jgi:hypothetical protein
MADLNTLAYIFSNGSSNTYACPYTTGTGSFKVCYKAYSC